MPGPGSFVGKPVTANGRVIGKIIDASSDDAGINFTFSIDDEEAYEQLVYGRINRKLYKDLLDAGVDTSAAFFPSDAPISAELPGADEDPISAELPHD